MVNCLSEYTNDYISNDKQTGQYSTATNMYEKMLEEGHDPRLLRFSPSTDETIKGGHQDPRNLDYWQVGCLGITESCTQVKYSSLYNNHAGWNKRAGRKISKN